MRPVFAGAVSGRRASANGPTVTPPIMYPAGTSGFPVSRVSHAARNCVEPPNTCFAGRWRVVETFTRGYF